MFESVDLPAPFSPRSACTSPSAASKSTPSFATTPGKRLTIPCNWTADMRQPSQMKRAGGETPPARDRVLALRAADDALDEPVHRLDVGQGHPLALRHAELPALVVD